MKNKTLYSSDFTFFLNHQIMVTQTKLGVIKYSSRLDGRLFSVKTINEKLHGDVEINGDCKEIHKTLDYYVD